MTTLETSLVVILTVLLSLFFIMCIVLVTALVKLVSSVKQVVLKAEGVVDSVESAAEVLKDTTGRLAFLKLVRNIMKLVQGDRK